MAVVNLQELKTQELIDSFYMKHGKCCAGCDWWEYANSVAGQCIRHAPVSGAERLSMTGISHISAPVGAGHPATVRDHYCGDFKDDFDWATLPASYLARIGKAT